MKLHRILKNTGFAALLLTTWLFACGMGEVAEHREELGTLKDEGEDQDAMEKELADHEAHFQNVKAAILRGELKEGMRTRELSGKLGSPDVNTATDPLPLGAHLDGAKMPHFMHIVGGTGMHQGFLPGYPASHGCIRMPGAMAEAFYRSVAVGTPVTIGP